MYTLNQVGTLHSYLNLQVIQHIFLVFQLKLTKQVFFRFIGVPRGWWLEWFTPASANKGLQSREFKNNDKIIRSWLAFHYYHVISVLNGLSDEIQLSQEIFTLVSMF